MLPCPPVVALRGRIVHATDSLMAYSMIAQNSAGRRVSVRVGPSGEFRTWMRAGTTLTITIFRGGHCARTIRVVQRSKADGLCAVSRHGVDLGEFIVADEFGAEDRSGSRSTRICVIPYSMMRGVTGMADQGFSTNEL